MDEWLEGPKEDRKVVQWMNVLMDGWKKVTRKISVNKLSILLLLF